MRPQGLLATSAAQIKKKAPGLSGAPSFVAKLFGVLKGGLSLPEPVVALLTAFMAVPAQAAVDAALKIAQALGQSDIPVLTPDQRAAVSLEVSQAALTLAPDVATALGRVPQVATATGVQGPAMQQHMEQEEELLGLSKVVALAQGLVGDARLQLQGWQFEAQGRLVAQIFAAFTGAKTTEERLQLVGDAGPALDALETQLEEQRATVAANAGAVAAQAGQVEQANNDLLMVQTMRDVRDGKPVDDALLRRMAVYYAQRVVAAPPDPGTTAGTGKEPKTTKTKTKAGKKSKKAPTAAS